MTAAVPDRLARLLHYLRKESKRLSTLKFVGIGGSACPPDMIRAFEDDYGVDSAPRLGHDRNEPARHGRLDQAEPDGPLARAEARAPMPSRAGRRSASR